MNKNQSGRYWHEWGQAKQVLKGGFSPAEMEARRKEITTSVGAASSAKFTDAQLTRALAQFRNIYAPNKSEQDRLAATASAQEDPRERILVLIRRTIDAISPQDETAYLAAICKRLKIPADLRICDFRELRSLQRLLEGNLKK